MPWDRYERADTAQRSDDPTLSIYADGKGRINKPAREEWFDPETTHPRVSIAVDPERGLFGIDVRPTEDLPEDLDTLSLGPSGDLNTNTTLRDKAGVDLEAIEETHRFELEIDADEGMAVADISALPGIEPIGEGDAVDDETDGGGDVGHDVGPDGDSEEAGTGDEYDLPLDHTDPDDLGLAYELADGNISEATEYFDVGYGAVYRRMRSAGVHETQSENVQDDDQDVAEDRSAESGPERVNGVDLSALGESGQQITAQMVTEALTGAQTVHQVERSLALGRHETEGLLEGLGVLERFKKGAPKLEAADAAAIVREAIS